MNQQNQTCQCIGKTDGKYIRCVLRFEITTPFKTTIKDMMKNPMEYKGKGFYFVAPLLLWGMPPSWKELQEELNRHVPSMMDESKVEISAVGYGEITPPPIPRSIDIIATVKVMEGVWGGKKDTHPYLDNVIKA